MRSNRLGLRDLGVVAGTGVVFLLLLLSGCTTIGIADRRALARMAIDEPPVALALCGYLDDGVTAEEAARLVDEAWREDAGLNHELHHMLGCDHGVLRTACSKWIATLKQADRAGFFPGWSHTGELLASRADVDWWLGVMALTGTWADLAYAEEAASPDSAPPAPGSGDR